MRRHNEEADRGDVREKKSEGQGTDDRYDLVVGE